MYNPVLDTENSIDGFMNYISTTEHVEEDLLYNQTAARSIQAEPFESSKIDLVIKPDNDQVPCNRIALPPPHQPYIQLELFPRQEQTPVKISGQRSFRNISPKSAQTAESRPGRGRVGRLGPLGPARREGRREGACWNCQIKAS
jgi:hypothetical protein